MLSSDLICFSPQLSEIITMGILFPLHRKFLFLKRKERDLSVILGNRKVGLFL